MAMVAAVYVRVSSRKTSSGQPVRYCSWPTTSGTRWRRCRGRRCCTRSAGRASSTGLRSNALEVNGWRRRRHDVPLTGYQELCRELSGAGPGTFGELDTTGARSVLRRFSDAWFAAAKRRKDGDLSARFPRRRRGLMPVRWYHGTFGIEGRRVRIPTAQGAASLSVQVGAGGAVPGRAGPVDHPAVRGRPAVSGRDRRSPRGRVPMRRVRGRIQARVAGVDLGIIHPVRGGRPGWVRGCWCRGGRSAPSTVCTWRTPKPAAARSPAVPRSLARRDRGGGASTAAGRGWWRAGIGGGSGRPSTKPLAWWCPGPSKQRDRCAQGR